jgi:hypothetical protein
MIGYVYDEGGRALAGFKGEAHDCVTRAITIATRKDYREVYEAINEAARHERPQTGCSRSSASTGVRKQTYGRYLAELEWTWVPTMSIGSGCTTHLRADELPGGTIIVRLSRHLAAVVDGVLHDTSDCSRDGTQCVYGYWHKET